MRNILTRNLSGKKIKEKYLELLGVAEKFERKQVLRKMVVIRLI
jgi:hypothetical protein